jgi:hypothetical protein
MSVMFKKTEKTEKQISEELFLTQITLAELSILIAEIFLQNEIAIAELSALIAGGVEDV